ncbi:MAG: ABC transporter permease [Rhodobacteraceae bacterium]|nr:ABC transporter permease [Paracoccaceae bacterium]
MGRGLAARIAGAVLTFWAIASGLFVLMQLAPGDAALALGGDFQTARTLAAEQARLGTDAGPGARYLDWMRGLVRGDPGQSLQYRAPVARIIAERLPVTLALVLPAFVLSALAGTGLALRAARAPGGTGDRLTALAVLTLYALPVYAVAHLLIVIFALNLGWLPVQGLRDLRAPATGGGAALLDAARHLVLPITALASQQMALVWLVVRAGLLEARAAPHFATALAKGLAPSVALRRHALPQAGLALAAALGARFAGLLTAATLIEVVFGLPGLGRLMVQAALARDHPLLLGCFLCAVLLTLLANAAADAACRGLDPRIGMQGP